MPYHICHIKVTIKSIFENFCIDLRSTDAVAREMEAEVSEPLVARETLGEEFQSIVTDLVG